MHIELSYFHTFITNFFVQHGSVLFQIGKALLKRRSQKLDMSHPQTAATQIEIRIPRGTSYAVLSNGMPLEAIRVVYVDSEKYPTAS